MIDTSSKIRLITAAALFDGHDAAINIMRRILQSKGAEVIHLGHNRSVLEIVEAAIEEDVHGIAVTSYQGGHLEFFKYMKDLLQENGCGHIKIFGGGGGTILPSEIDQLHRYGINRIYSPDDGRRLGLEGMIEDLLSQCKIQLNGTGEYEQPLSLDEAKDIRKIARAITNAENGVQQKQNGHQAANQTPVLGITGTGGAGKSSVTDEVVRRFLQSNENKTVAVISVDPSKKKTGGALLGDRIRMNAISSPRAYMRSLATRETDKALSVHVQDAIQIAKAAGYDLIILESAGVGQSDASILDYCDVSLYVMTPEYGAASQLEKINMLDFADLIAINKFDKAGALDALHDVRKQYKRSHQLWTASDGELPIIGTTANKFNDAGVNLLFNKVVELITSKTGVSFQHVNHNMEAAGKPPEALIAPKRVRYLSEIAENNRQYDRWAKEQSVIASKLYQVVGVIEQLGEDASAYTEIDRQRVMLEEQLHPECKKLLQQWQSLQAQYKADFFEYSVRGKVIKQPLTTTSLSGLQIPKVVLPQFKDWGDVLRWQLQENVPGEFPYTAGVFPLKRSEEDPTR
ncbi:MAG TPA: cobalamin-dependent protein, partial [Chitinophagaceae bacterium]|nr:cobalamin-dependent protein [Chitinophagaceae bacterium]